MADKTGYHLVLGDEHLHDTEDDPKDDALLKKSLLLPQLRLLLVCTIVGIALVSVGVIVGYNFKELLAGHIYQIHSNYRHVPLRSVNKSFEYNSTFAIPPSPDIESEPIWDNLIPKGLGYFIDEKLSPNVSITSVFHQLHCLYTLRRAFYSVAPDGQLESFDFGRDRSIHVAHCFDYLVQSITCMSDTTIEPAVDREHGFLGSGIQRECRDFDQLKTWSQQRRAIDATGFLAKSPYHQD